MGVSNLKMTIVGAFLKLCIPLSVMSCKSSNKNEEQLIEQPLKSTTDRQIHTTGGQMFI